MGEIGIRRSKKWRRKEKRKKKQQEEERKGEGDREKGEI